MRSKQYSVARQFIDRGDPDDGPQHDGEKPMSAKRTEISGIAHDIAGAVGRYGGDDIVAEIEMILKPEFAALTAQLAEANAKAEKLQAGIREALEYSKKWDMMYMITDRLAALLENKEPNDNV